MSRELTPQEAAERSLIKKYRKELWNPFIAAVKRYELIAPRRQRQMCIRDSSRRSDRRLYLRGKGLHGAGQADAGAPAPHRTAL